MKTKNLCGLFYALVVITLFFSANNISAQTRAWGYNFYGALGIGNTTNQPTPTTVGSVPDAVGIRGGLFHVLFLKADGTVAAAGDNGYGQLGDGTLTQRNAPVAVTGLTNVVHVTAGDNHSIALLADGSVYGWGRNHNGQVGNGTVTTNQTTPTQTSISDVVQLDSGGEFTLAVKADGTVWAWGSNGVGNLGDGTTTRRPTPVQIGVGVSGFNNIVAVSAGEGFSMALKSDGTVWVWGRNSEGELGNGATSGNLLTPVQNNNLTNVTAIHAGAYHCLALRRDGTVWAWGYNSNGQGGNGTVGTNQLTPVQISGISNAVELASTAYTNVVRLSDGSVRAWGENGNGEVGNGAAGGNQLTPTTTLVGTGNTGIGNGYYAGYSGKPTIALSTGTNQNVRGDNLTANFSNVTGAGNFVYTAIDPSMTGLNVPMGYTIQANQPAYSLTKTATTSGNIQVCLKVNEPNPANYPYLKILHEEGADLVDRTTSYSAALQRVCATVSDFSRFVVAQSLAPTAASVSLGGRVSASKGMGLANAVVYLTDQNGNTRVTRTSSFGYFRFAEVEVGQSVVIQVSARSYTFAPLTFTVNEELKDLNFTAQ